MQIPYVLCIDCIHLDLKNKKNGKPICKAYPNGIPKEVIEEKIKSVTKKDTQCNLGYRFEHV